MVEKKARPRRVSKAGSMHQRPGRLSQKDVVPPMKWVLKRINKFGAWVLRSNDQ